MNKKNRNRCELLGVIVLVSVVLLLVIYFVGSKSESGPSIRVLQVSCGNESTAVNKSGISEVAIISQRLNASVIVNTSNLIEDSSKDESRCPKQVILECTAGYPVLWLYDGYGAPNVTTEMFRKTDNFNDVSSYRFIAMLSFNLITERASGRYRCSPVSSEMSEGSSFVHLFFPSTKDNSKLFVIANDITVESDTEKELLVPCPVADPDVNVSLVYNGQPITENYISQYKPETGFYLNAKFLEENDPFGTFYCEDGALKKSGRVTITSKKDSVVRMTPKNSTINYDSEFNGVFKCEAKENITLKFRRVTNSNRVAYALDSASDFPFMSQVHFERRDLREGSIISCLTVSKRIELHSWKVLLSMSGEIQLSEFGFFGYKEDTDEFSCCSVSTKMPKLSKTDCSDVPSCLIGKSCVERRTCNTKSLKLTQKSTCVNYKLEYKSNMSSGLLHCWVDDTIKSYAYFAYKGDDNNNTLKDFKEISGEPIPTVSLDSRLLESVLSVQEVNSVKHEMGMRYEYRCSGPAFYFARGFKWQVSRVGGSSDFLDGEEIMKDGWIESRRDFEIPSNSAKFTKRIYCFAPFWNSPTEWSFAIKDFIDS